MKDLIFEKFLRSGDTLTPDSDIQTPLRRVPADKGTLGDRPLGPGNYENNHEFPELEDGARSSYLTSTLAPMSLT
jgi:hypothetical protein